MTIIQKDNIEWFIDNPAFADFIQTISFGDILKRSHLKYIFQSERIFIKAFYEKGLYGLIRNKVVSRGEKEYTLGKRLMALSIPVPEPLGYGIAKQHSYVIQRWIEADSLLTLFKSSKNKEVLLTLLASFLKKLASASIRHNDLHLDNILVKDGILYLVDLHQMKIKKLFNRTDEISNLTHALAMVYDGIKEKEKELFFNAYGAPDLRGHVEDNIQRLKRRWIRKKKKRAFDETSRIHLSGDYVYLTGYEDYGKGEPVEVIKDDRKVRVERYTDHIRKYYKSKRRLERAWKNHVVLSYMNYSLGPQAFYVYRPPFPEYGYIAMEDLKSHGEEMDRYLHRQYGQRIIPERKLLIERLARFFHSMFQKNIIHKDCKGCNIFVCEGMQFRLLDIEDVAFREIDEERLIKMLVQLNTTIPRSVGFNDRMRFFLRLTSIMTIDRKKIFSQVIKRSLRQVIVYEGTQGLTREYW